MKEQQHIETLKDRRSAYVWLLAILVLAVSLGMCFAPNTEQPLFVWLLVAIISIPTFLLFVLGTFTSYFDLKITEKGISFGGYSGRRNLKWEEITDITIYGGNECPHISISLTPILKNEMIRDRANEILPKLYGLSPEEFRAKMKHWQDTLHNCNVNNSESDHLLVPQKSNVEPKKLSQQDYIKSILLFLILFLWSCWDVIQGRRTSGGIYRLPPEAGALLSLVFMSYLSIKLVLSCFRRNK